MLGRLLPDRVNVHKSDRAVGLDGLRGVAVLLMLLDHALVVVQVRYPLVVWVRILLTRPALPLFMIVSGTLLAKHGDGAVVKQAVHVLPWAIAATGAAAFIPGFGFPEPLGVYLVALALVDLALTYDVVPLAMCACFLVAVQKGLWPLDSYDPAELAGWIMLGWLAWDMRGSWWCRWDSLWPSWLMALGRRSLYWYVGQLLALAVVCQAIGMRGYLL